MATSPPNIPRGLWELRGNVGPFQIYYATHQVWFVTEGRAGPVIRQKTTQAEALAAAEDCEKYRVAKEPKKRPANDRGQGRKPLGAGGSVHFGMRMSMQDRAKLDRLGGAVYLRRVIKQALDPDDPQPVRRFD